MGMILGGWAKEAEEEEQRQRREFARQIRAELEEEARREAEHAEPKPMGSFLDD